VGTFRHSLLVDHGFVWDSSTGQAYDLNNVVMSNDTWELFYPWGINDAGQITGAGSHVDPEDDLYRGRGFVLTPDTTTPSLQSLSITPTSVSGSSTATGIVMLTKAAPTGGALSQFKQPNLDANEHARYGTRASRRNLGEFHNRDWARLVSSQR
jgi:hypothetical protein